MPQIGLKFVNDILDILSQLRYDLLVQILDLYTSPRALVRRVLGPALVTLEI